MKYFFTSLLALTPVLADADIDQLNDTFDQCVVRYEKSRPDNWAAGFGAHFECGATFFPVWQACSADDYIGANAESCQTSDLEYLMSQFAGTMEDLAPREKIAVRSFFNDAVKACGHKNEQESVTHLECEVQASWFMVMLAKPEEQVVE